jgi:hypothetical protein
LPGGTLVDSLRCLPSLHDLGVSRSRVEENPTWPPGLGPVAALFSQDGEVAQVEVTVDSLVDATELIETLEREDPPPAGFGLGGLAGLAAIQLGVVGVEPSEKAFKAAAYLSSSDE